MRSFSQQYSSPDGKEIRHYVQLMQENSINTIVEMNKYISRNKKWNDFSTIRRENTYQSGFTSIGISKDAYKSICELYQTEDSITTFLIGQKRI